MENFLSLGLPEKLIHTIDSMGFKKPTAIQAETIPHALAGHDILGSSHTGSGKTAAFGIPLIAHLINNPEASALVLTPTRELAFQVLQTLHLLLGKKSKIKSALLIGGDSMYKQLQMLKAGPRLVVGTPGRINDHLDRKTLDLSKADFLVFDETDRMLDMGFGEQIEDIARYLPQKRQTLMFSATMPKNIVNIAGRYLKNPVRVDMGDAMIPQGKIEQKVVHTTEPQKYEELLRELSIHDGPCIVFTKTKVGADKVARRLKADGEEAAAIHGDLRQRQREQVIRRFKVGKHRVLVATDVASRGLDIPDVACVINYDLTQTPEDYIHRIGRTGRAGASGIAVSFVSTTDKTKWKIIERMMNGGKLDDAGEAFQKAKGKGKGRGARPSRKAKGKGKDNFIAKKRTERKMRDAKKADWAPKTDSESAEKAFKKHLPKTKKASGHKPGPSKSASAKKPAHKGDGEQKRTRHGQDFSERKGGEKSRSPRKPFAMKKPFGAERAEGGEGASVASRSKGPKGRSFGSKKGAMAGKARPKKAFGGARKNFER